MTWNFYYDDEAENHFISDEHENTVAMVHQEEQGPLLASAPDMRDEIARLRANIVSLRTAWTLGDLQESDFENALQRKEGNG